MVKIAVALIRQMPEMPTGCEIAALTMILQTAGSSIDKITLAHELPYHDSDPNQGFVGDPFSQTGYSIYPPALTATIEKYIGNSIILSGETIDVLKKHLQQQKHPILVWLGPIYGFTIHALVLTGYDEAGFIINDCWLGKEITMDYSEFAKLWENKGKLAISY
ncbi:MAG TPA: C39 family peptidase [Tetragenococcus sp.]|nr:C39 family peptidase [Tetragenococcus sp.]